MSGQADDVDPAEEIAEQLLDAATGAGDVDAELARVAEPDALAVLAAVVRALASFVAAEHLREDPETQPAEESAPDGVANPWAADDPATEALMTARLLWDALAGQDDVAGVLRGVRAIDEDEARAVVLERALVSMAERPPGNR